MILSSASGSKLSFYLKYTIDGEILHNNCKSVIDKYGNVVSFQQGLPFLKCVEYQIDWNYLYIFKCYKKKR